MLQLRAYAPPDRADLVHDRLADTSGVRHLVVGGRTAGGMVQLTAEIESSAADVVVEVLQQCDLAADDVTLWLATSVQPLGWRRRESTTSPHTAVWSAVAARARDNSRPALTFVLYMLAAGVVAGVGVLTGSSILVVGAMAISPDLLPMAAAAVGLVERRHRLATRAMATLVCGMGLVSLAAAGSTLLLRLSDRIEANLDLADTVLGVSLTRVGPGAVLVALAAGMVGMLAFETVGSAAVGVAISVTTVPAAAYAGDALALQGYQRGADALVVLATNVVVIVTAASLTLWVQRRARAGGAGRRDVAP